MKKSLIAGLFALGMFAGLYADPAEDAQFQQYVKLFPQWQKCLRFKTVPDAGHNKVKVMFDSPEFLALVFGRTDDLPTEF